MTQSDLAPYLTAMREFMRHTRDPQFRAYLRRIGWHKDQDVVIAFDHELIIELVSRLSFNQVGSPCLVAIPHTEERFGFRLMFMATVRPRPRWTRWRQPHVEPISTQATIGMLFSSLTGCDAYVPSEWTNTVRFSRVPEPA